MCSLNSLFKFLFPCNREILETICLSPWTCLFCTFHINATTQFVTFYVWLLPFSLVFLRFSHVEEHSSPHLFESSSMIQVLECLLNTNEALLNIPYLSKEFVHFMLFIYHFMRLGGTAVWGPLSLGQDSRGTALTSVPCPSLGRWGQLSRPEADCPGRVRDCPSPPPPCTHWTLPSLRSSGWRVPVPEGLANSSSQTLFPPGSTCTRGPSPAFLRLLALTSLHPSISSPPWKGNGHGWGGGVGMRNTSGPG